MNRELLRAVASERGLVGGPFGSSLVNADYTDDGVPVIRGTNMSAGRFIGGEFAFVSPEKFARDLIRNSAVPRDIIYTQRGTLGQVALVPNGVAETFVVSQSQMRLRVDPQRAIPEFVYYASTTNEFLKQIDDRAISTGVPHTNLGILAELEIPLPPLAEQQAIAEVLGALDDKIAANTALAVTADLCASALLLGSLSTDRVRLDSIARITMGSSPKGEALNELGDGVPFYQGVRDYGFRSPTRRVFTTSPVRSADTGDILVSVRAPVGDVNVANEPLCIGRGVAAVRSTIGTQATLFHQLKAERDAWEPYEAEGTVFGSINRDQLHGIQVRPVTSERADLVESELAVLEASINATLAENRTLADARDTLLPQLMSGKLRVRDADEAASAAGA